jgi:phosphoribosylaminoimidazolecarboxamide formyltransferase/IMP cyclohydrolase
MNLSTRWALISVSDKRGVIDFAQGLCRLGYQIASTGGTATLLRQQGVVVTDVSTITGSPEILDGRVKSLHPKIHGGILFDRKNHAHLDQVVSLDIPNIELVAVNLYPFKPGTKIDEANASEEIELIDIGGPAMIRAAAKNFQNIIPVIDPDDYQTIIEELQLGALGFDARKRLAAKVFSHISTYDSAIAEALSNQLPLQIRPHLVMQQSLRYGENPHQQAALYLDADHHSPELGQLKCLQGKELSYNNYLDIEAAIQNCRELHTQPHVAVVIKHTNPCGAAVSHSSISEALEWAILSDPKSAFGGIIALSSPVDGSCARIIAQQFYECIVAPSFDSEALQILGAKKNLRLLTAPFLRTAPGSMRMIRNILDGFLVQDCDLADFDVHSWRCVTTQVPSSNLRDSMEFAMHIARQVKSNAIVIASGMRVIGVGAGQMSRVDAAEIALSKAIQHRHTLKGAVVASDAFFPFRDCVDLFAKHDIAAIIQPGGSVRDQESIDACNEHGITMLFSGIRHFKH